MIVLMATTPENSNKWLINIDEAKKEAKNTERPILLSFQGSDWCANCIRLERSLFESESFKNYASENLILLKADFPSRKKNKLSDEQTAHNEKLAEKFNKEGAFPTVIILNAEGCLLYTSDAADD